jgi:Uncharacterized protein involved in cytokinesis, contains TGc (transglutaminase/protease-like) domain
MKFLKSVLSLTIVLFLAFLIYELALNCSLVPENVRNSVSQVTEEVRSAAAQFAAQVGEAAGQAKGYAHSIEVVPGAATAQAEVKTPAAAADLNSVWGETGMKGLAIYEYGKTLLNSKERAIYCAIADAVTNVQKSVSFNTELPPAQVEKIYEYDVSDHAEVFYNNGVAYQYTQYGNFYTYKITFKYKYGGSKSKIESMRAQLRQKALSMLNAVKSASTDLSKEKALHDALVKGCSYDVRAAQNSAAYPDSYSAYGALVKSKAVCQGYAQAMDLLLSSCGIKSLYVSGEANGGSHAWNEVQIGGKWYSLDATFDDPVYTDSSGNYTGENSVGYTYFNFTKKLDHTAGKFNSADPLSPSSQNYAKMPKIG